jgi:DNA-binding NtrC family response regulator
MSVLFPPRKVLIIEDDSTIRNLLFGLLATVGCEGEAALDGQQALGMISRESFDAIILDLRCSNPSTEEVVSHIREIRPSLVGRILVITGETASAEAIDLIERHFLIRVSENSLLQNLRGWLQLILHMDPRPRRGSPEDRTGY